MKYFILLSLLWCIPHLGTSQGCVAIRSNGGSCTMTGAHNSPGDSIDKKAWDIALNTRYFRSYKHFVGKEEQKERVENGSEVINTSYSAELGLTRMLNNRWSASFYLPIITNIRSSKYEHYGNASKNPNARRITSSHGLGDLRFAAYYWLLNPVSGRKFNMQLGAGIKLPTGNYHYADYFYKDDSTRLSGPVDQSIQLGDGGLGITGEYSGYYQLNKNWRIYSNGYYLFNPREDNSVSTARGNTPSAISILAGSDVMSVPDQYMFRGGMLFHAGGFMASAGLRTEGIPAYDVFGGSNGFRRPGYVLTAEPVISFLRGRLQFYVSVPYALERNRTRSVPDRLRTEVTGVYAHGDAAFADYSVNFGSILSF